MDESQHTELKRSLATIDDIIQATVAFKNATGGQILIGIEDDGKIVGIDVGKNTIENLSRDISNNTSPKIYPRIDEEKMGQKNIIKITVDEGTQKPYFAKGIAYKRVGKTNLKMDANEIERLILIRHSSRYAFDNLPCQGATMEDIDEQKVREFLILSQKTRKSSYEFKSLKDTLLSLNLLDEDEKILNTTILLFGKNPQKFFPQYVLHCGRIKGGQLTDISLVEGTLVEIVEHTMQFIRNYMKKKMEIIGTRRIERYEYPEEAVREAIINSIIHRDFTIPSNCYVALYEDRIEIKNPGIMPSGITLEDLKKEDHPSLRRNKIFARMAFLIGYVEQWGTGTTKIIRLCREQGLKDPVFSEDMGFFKVTMYNTSPKLSARQRGALELFKEGGELGSLDYAKRFKITDRYARKELSQLEEMGFIISKREGKKIRYYIGTT